MSEIVTSVPAPKIQSRRCLACRLPAELREEIERDRLRGWSTFAEITEKLRSRGFTLSDSAVRRHFGHVDRDSYFQPLPADSGGDAEPISTPFDGLVNAEWLSEKNVAETLVRAVVQRLQELDRQQRTVRDQPGRERLGSRYLQTLGALERASKRLAEMRKPERDVKRIVAEALQQATIAVQETYRTATHEHLALVRSALFDLLDKRLQPEDFLGLIKRWDEEWPTALVQRVGETMILSFRAAGAQA
jgi:hypothetical protein